MKGEIRIFERPMRVGDQASKRRRGDGNPRSLVEMATYNRNPGIR